jgi:cytochrome b561
MSTNSVIPDSGLTPANATSGVIKPKRYHPLLVALHWLMAILILGAVLLVQENEGGERSRPRTDNFSSQGLQTGTASQTFDSDEASQNVQGGAPRRENQGVLSGTGLHMILGISILVLLVVRLAVRWGTQHPEWASTGNKLFDWVGNLTHLGLYVLTFGMAITGIILANQRGILARVFGVGATPAAGTYLRGGFRFGMLHGGIWTLLLLLIILHVGAALYHQFILKDNLMGRMWFGKNQ